MCLVMRTIYSGGLRVPCDLNRIFPLIGQELTAPQEFHVVNSIRKLNSIFGFTGIYFFSNKWEHYLNVLNCGNTVDQILEKGAEGLDTDVQECVE